MEKRDFYCKFKSVSTDHSEIKRTKHLNKLFDIKNGEELTRLYMKTDNILLAALFENVTKIYTKEYEVNPLFCVSICSYFHHCGLKHTGINLQTLQDKDMILLIEKSIKGGIGSVMDDRYVKSDDFKRMLFIDATN